VSVPTALVIAALVVALVDEVMTRGRSLLGWAVVLVCAALLWGRLS
jgi:hypothetical protein